MWIVLGFYNGRADTFHEEEMGYPLHRKPCQIQIRISHSVELRSLSIQVWIVKLQMHSVRFSITVWNVRGLID